MIESLILSEFEPKDYGLFDQQILGLELSPEEIKETLSRILQTKTQSFQNKVTRLLQEGKQHLLELAFKRAKKRYKIKIALRYSLSEQRDMGE
ncbi:MAG: hypothetical protein HWN66_04330 [Candidatus Helarchaeota archaeon]|nr:hypothetical protein [Candidatus Helarchaeota archaeon]